MTGDIDIHVGKRLRRRRRLLGLTQQNLASQVGIRFQQIQKYECGANRVSAARLFELSEALRVPVQYFTKAYPNLMIAIAAKIKTAWPRMSYRKRNDGFGARLLSNGRGPAQTFARSGQITLRQIPSGPSMRQRGAAANDAA